MMAVPVELWVCFGQKRKIEPPELCNHHRHQSRHPTVVMEAKVNNIFSVHHCDAVAAYSRSILHRLIHDCETS
jgi:hypothetical protein